MGREWIWNDFEMGEGGGRLIALYGLCCIVNFVAITITIIIVITNVINVIIITAIISIINIDTYFFHSMWSL